MNIKTTEIGQSYWDETGAYQKEFTELCEKLIPFSGPAETVNGELIRASSRLLYEFLNNGNINACDQIWVTDRYSCEYCNGEGYIGYDEDYDDDELECNNCYGSGEIEEEYIENREVEQYYAEFLELIENEIPEANEIVEQITQIIEADLYNDDNQFTDERINTYDRLIDMVVHHVLNTEDKPLETMQFLHKE